ncbi:hotdog fold thioesterase [Staphylococcus xylosus]|uniref:hotdog fold thioesterase n=1 Tax=Staphylococcus xylosus TaxID=1288 RepID=UPI000D1D5724|nr:hotdog fold thioesterase [Staphylococcus xylosus]MDO5515210.1 hotdog fold thioesterase [Staphylococcus xylosus]MEB6322287.1 hotdog fold thioesterase [Staphylococcus xylosus]MEB7383570.1 hotdog fold thioesterase [Staphylococcus xylosus]MEB7830912.1 hotdog fold thioesterase [Staphylococcus xylosus]MEB8147340.1 hotdog fold thioesterase [Staphylococcus xylosus]
MANMLDALDIKVVKQERGLMVMSMPVTDNVKQPFGYLHGGASLALGETACSMGAAYLIDTEQYVPLGLEMNGNHISSTTEGTIFATATIIHEGKTTQVWSIDIKDDKDRLICVMRGTIAIKPLKR